MFTDTLSGWDRPPPTADLDVKQQQQPNTYGKWQCVAPPHTPTPPTTHVSTHLGTYVHNIHEQV